MKRILAAAALTALIASPAVAANYGWHSSRAQAFDSYASTNMSAGYGITDPVTGYSYVGPHTVVQNGMILGADPDPAVRMELKRSSPLLGTE